MKFRLGQVVMTKGVANSLSQEDIFKALSRHSKGDWGEIGEEDKKENEFALDKRLRLLSAYVSSCGKRFWIITEADRSATTVLFPDEY